MTITELIKQAHETATEKGWWDKEPTFGELIALCHSELSEALEEFRNGCGCEQVDYEGGLRGTETAEPVGIPIELADVIIRIADLCGHYGIDLEEALKQKMEYNKSRAYRHGGKVI